MSSFNINNINLNLKDNPMIAVLSGAVLGGTITGLYFFNRNKKNKKEEQSNQNDQNNKLNNVSNNVSNNISDIVTEPLINEAVNNVNVNTLAGDLTEIKS